MDNTTIGGRSVAHPEDLRQPLGALVAAVEAHTVRARLDAQQLPKAVAELGLDGAKQSPMGQTLKQLLRQLAADLHRFAAAIGGSLEEPQAAAAQLQRLTAAMGPLVGRLPQTSPASVQALWQLQPALMHKLQQQCRALGLGSAQGAPRGAPQGSAAPAQDSVQVRAPLPEAGAAPRPQRPVGLQAPKMVVQHLATPMPGPPTLRVGLRNVRLVKVKVKYDARVYRHLNLGEHTFAKIYLESGHFFTMAATTTRGAFGKIRPGVDAQGRPVAVKVIRHESKPGADKLGQTKTHPQLQEEVYRELELTTKLRGTLDAAVADVPLLQTVRRSCAPFINHGIVTVRSTAGSDIPRTNTFMVMSREAGDLYNLYSMVTMTAPPERQAAVGAALARSVALQGFFELYALHQLTGHAHLDLSLRNLFIGHGGQIKVMDFGFAVPLNERGATDRRGFFGSIMTPEAVMPAPMGQDREPLTHAVDTFAMAALVFAVSVPDPAVQNPFSGGRRIDRPEWSGLSFRAYGQQIMELFAAWRAERQRPESTWIDAAAIVQGPQDTVFSPFFAPLAKTEPRLAQLMLNGAMAMQPLARQSSAQVISVLYGILPQQHPAQEELLEYFAGVSLTPERDPIFAKARTYDAWDRKFTEKEVARQLRPGHPKPLP